MSSRDDTTTLRRAHLAKTKGWSRATSMERKRDHVEVAAGHEAAGAATKRLHLDLMAGEEETNPDYQRLEVCIATAHTCSNIGKKRYTDACGKRSAMPSARRTRP